eukprot:m.22777 g.22777  ORF g.22777 m.22777 type:complete len:451 (-) comp7437_c0_seq1:50-1402(-)
MEIFNDSGGVSIVDSPEIIQNGNSSPDGLSSTESRNTELPDYAAVADVTDNEVEFMLEVKRYDDRPILIGVSPIDTIAFLKKKIHRVQLDVAPENQLIRDQTGRFLANGQGIWLAGLRPESVVSLFILHADNEVFGPGEVSDDLVVLTKDEVNRLSNAEPRPMLLPDRDFNTPNSFRNGTSHTESEMERMTSVSPEASELSSHETRERMNSTGGMDHDNFDSSGKNEASDSSEESDEEDPPAYDTIDTAGRDTAPDNEFEMTTCKWILVGILGVVWFFIMLAMLGLPVALITMGILHQSDCPSKPRIPDWMVVMGFIMLIWTVLLRIAAKKRAKIETEIRSSIPHIYESDLNALVEKHFVERYRKLSQAIGIVQGFQIIWFIIGSIWVFSCSECRDEEFDKSEGLGCHEATYDLAFWFLIVVYILSALPFVLFSIWVSGAILIHQCCDRR